MQLKLWEEKKLNEVRKREDERGGGERAAGSWEDGGHVVASLQSHDGCNDVPPHVPIISPWDQPTNKKKSVDVYHTWRGGGESQKEKEAEETTAKEKQEKQKQIRTVCVCVDQKQVKQISLKSYSREQSMEPQKGERRGLRQVTGGGGGEGRKAVECTQASRCYWGSGA